MTGASEPCGGDSIIQFAVGSPFGCRLGMFYTGGRVINSMEDPREFLLDAVGWGVASMIAASVFFAASVWEHTRASISSYTFLCIAVLLSLVLAWGLLCVGEEGSKT